MIIYYILDITYISISCYTILNLQKTRATSYLSISMILNFPLPIAYYFHSYLLTFTFYLYIMAAIIFDHVRKSYTVPDNSSLLLYDDLSFSIPEGSFASLMGSSGSGKTTLLNLIAGLILPDSGSISILGHDLTQMDDAARTILRGEHIGFIFQSFNLLPYLTVEQNIELVLDLNTLERRYTTDEICSLVGLS